MKKREAKAHSFNIAPYIRAVKLYGNFEIKATINSTLRLTDARLKRQVESLISAQNEGYYWKHSDQDQREKPFDSSFVPPIIGYVIVKFPSFFCIIRATVLQKEMNISKSLSQDRAVEIAEKKVS